MKLLICSRVNHRKTGWELAPFTGIVMLELYSGNMPMEALAKLF